MPINPKVAGTYKNASGLFAKVDGGWKRAQFGYVKVAGQWKQFWASSLEDNFDRADTTNTLGTSQSGQGWNIVRSQWRINSNNANTTGAKSDYPLALVDLGITEIEAEMNGMSPGMGLALRATNANNWVAIYPYYRQESFTFEVCEETRTVFDCVQQCPNPAYFEEACLPPNQLSTTSEAFFDCFAPGCNATEEGPSFICVDCDPCPEPGGTQFVCPPGECYELTIGGQTYSWCEDAPFSECNWVTTPPDCGCCLEYVEGEISCSESDPGCYTVITDTSCNPGGFSLVPVYDCCQFVQREECVRTGTRTGTNTFFYIRVAQMVNGTFSVIQDVQVNRRWNALKVTASGNTLAINAYGNSSYTDLVASANVTANLAGTQYGVIGAPSLFEDGRNISEIKVKGIGQ